LERAAAAAPDGPQAAIVLARFHLQNGTAQQGLLIAQKLQANFPDQPGVLRLLADAQGATGDGQAALDNWNKLARLQPANASVQLDIANVELSLQHTHPAMRSLERAIALQPDYPQAQAMLAGLHIRERGYGAALDIVHTMRRQHPDAPLSYLLEGDLLMQQKQAAAALRAYQRGYALAPSGALAIAIHDAQRMDGHAAAARTALSDWLREHPRDQAVRMRLAQGLLADKDYRGALAQFDLAVQQDPGNVIALNNLAWACQQQRDPRAAAFAERAYRLAPHNAAVLDTLAWILKDQGQTARALTLAQQANAAAPASLDIRYHYAVLLADAGRRQEARTQFEQLLAHKDFGRRPEVQAMLARW
jgi:putative PEP-CTERM system TPR-repeat lipoprotein